MAKSHKDFMRILHISDTHGFHRRLQNLPEADVIVHSGDITMTGGTDDAVDFMEWFCDLPYPYKVFIAGNHDFCLHGGEPDGLDGNCHYLRNDSVEIDGLKFHGIPLSVEDSVSGSVLRCYAAIPDDTDVLITHQPPLNILDLSEGYHYGSPELRSSVMRVRPRAHLFGHIHDAAGMVTSGDIVFSNGAVLTGDYKMNLRPYNLIEIGVRSS